jgi:hypothetical protein
MTIIGMTAKKKKFISFALEKTLDPHIFDISKIRKCLDLMTFNFFQINNEEKL